MSLTLIIINNAFEHDKQRVITGDNLYELARSAYPKGLPLNTYLYHDKWDNEHDVTPQNQVDIDHINRLTGRFYLVTYPAAAVPLVWAVVASVAVSVAVAFLMPRPGMPNVGGSSQPPSPNNALAQRTNRQRLGGRVPDIFGTVWALPDLIAPSYSIYIDHKEVEYSYMCLGVGRYDVQKAYDDTTPIGYINGSTVSIFEPNKSFRDVPDVRFGSHLSTAEQGYLGLFVKRYGAVNGQVLPPPNNYLMLDDGVTFTPPNIIRIVGRSLNQFRAGGKLLIESAAELTSIKQFLQPKATDVSSNGNENDVDNTSTQPLAQTPILPYNLNGNYTIERVGTDSIALLKPERVASDWERLIANADTANGAGIVISTEEKPIWEGWFYTDLADHDNVIVNLKAPNGLYTSYGNDWVTLGINCEVESELVDDNARPIQGTRHFKNIFIKSPKYENYLDGQGRAWVRTTDDDVRRTAAITAYIDNPHLGVAKKCDGGLGGKATPLHPIKDRLCKKCVLWTAMVCVI